MEWALGWGIVENATHDDPVEGKMAMGRVHISAARKAAILKKEAGEAKKAEPKKKAKNQST
jgi:hypothetical protein